MSKLKGRAGIALTSAVALVGSALVGTPAVAAGMADTSFVSLKPTSGLSYNVLAVAGADFSLSSNQAAAVAGAGRNLKFLVEDPNEVVSPAFGTTGETLTPKLDDGLTISIDTATEIITVTDSDLQAAVGVGQYIYFTDDVDADDGGDDSATKIADKEIAFKVLTSNADNDTISFKSNLNLADDSLDATDVDGNVPDVVVISEARDATTKSFVVDSALATNTSDKKLVLNNDASVATVSVNVTAWVDDNGDGDIDATEYASPARTVTWVKPSTITPTVTWTPVVIGDETAVASVTLSPTINWDQADKADFEVDVNRQGSNATIGSDDGTAVAESWSTLLETWTITTTLSDTKANIGAQVWDVNAVSPNKGNAGVYSKTATNDDTSDITHYAQSGTTATLYFDTPHGFQVNDTVTVANFLASAAGAKITAVSSTTISYTTSAASATTAKTAVGDNNPTVTLVKFGFAAPGDYKATVKVGGTPAKIGSTSVISAGAQVAAGVKNVATVTDNVAADFKVRTDHVAAVQVTSTVTDADGDAVAAGIPVAIAVSETSAGIVVVNGTTVTTSKTLNTTTDANGQVVITVTNSSGASGDTVQLAVSSQGYSDTDTLTWTNAAYALTDLNDNNTNGIVDRSVAAGGDVSFRMVLRDQWGAAPAGDFRLKIVGAGGRYDSTTYAAMSSGTLNYDYADSAVDAADSTGTITFTVQQKNAAGSWVAPNGTAPLVALKADGNGELDQDAITVTVRGTNGTSVSLSADGVNSADLSVDSAIKALKAADTRNAGVAANDLSLEATDVTATIAGSVVDKFTGVAQPGSTVTISGNAAILFENGSEAAFGSLTVLADNAGAFSVNAYSNAGLTDSVVTVAANGASSTVKLTFAGAAADGGTTLTVTAPASAAAGTTFQVTAKLADKYGNGVKVATAGDVKVTYTGPGLVVGTLPNTTDADGELTFSVLLGSGDKGTATVTVSYDQNSDDDFKDAKDLVVAKTIYVGQAAPSDSKVNAGSFKGYVAIYAKGHEGKRLSAKVGNDWVVVPALASNFVRVVEFTGAGYTIAVRIYIDRVLVDTITVVTK